jgi:hypothetical protein
MTHTPDGSILDVGRKTRTISPALRRALLERDEGCCFPGCGSTRCDAHHLLHWADGGATSLENTMLLCRFHHRLVHEEGFQLKRLPGGEIEFRSPHGHLLQEAPAPPCDPIDPFTTLVKRLEDGGLVVDPYTGTALWDGSPPDLGLAIEWFLAKTSKALPVLPIEQAIRGPAEVQRQSRHEVEGRGVPLPGSVGKHRLEDDPTDSAWDAVVREALKRAALFLEGDDCGE